MTDPPDGPDLPPDVPEEYLEAYLRGYQQAYQPPGAAAAPPTEPRAGGVDPETEPQAQLSPLEELFTWSDEEEPRATRQARQRPQPRQPRQRPQPRQPRQPRQRRQVAGPAAPSVVPTAAQMPPPAGPPTGPPKGPPRHRGSAPFVALAVVAALAVLGGAYAVGRAISSNEPQAAPEEPRSDSPTPGRTKHPEPKKPTPTRPTATGTPVTAPWTGPVGAVTVDSVRVPCVLPPGEDAAGNRVTYVPVHMVDGDLTTAWRCGDDGSEVTVEITFAAEVDLAEVGMVPGYAKTDPRTGADRYAENDRITRVRWVMPDGSSFIQVLDGSADRRDLQTMRIPPQKVTSVELVILGVVTGPRRTLAISELTLAEAER